MSKEPTTLVALSPRSGKKVAALDQPPLGHLQALILKTLEGLGSDASGYGVLERLSLAMGVWIDHAQVYGSVRKLLENGLIEQIDERREKRRGPPLKIYAVTKAGHAALAETLAHHEALTTYLTATANPKATKPKASKP